jgi:hypothetical protein
MFLFMIPLIISQSFSDGRATKVYCMDPDITANQAHLPAPIICVDFTWGQGWRYYNNQQNSIALSCYCCCFCVSNCQVNSCAVLSFMITRLHRVSGEPRMCSWISSPVLSIHWVGNVQPFAFTGCIGPVKIPQGENCQLFPKISIQGCQFKSCSEYCFDTLKSI